MNITVGANAGAGLDIKITNTFVIEAGADYHYLYDLNTTHTQFIHAHAGLQFRF